MSKFQLCIRIRKQLALQRLLKFSGLFATAGGLASPKGRGAQNL